MDAYSATVGILGPFDRDDLGAALAARILRSELAQRCPGARVELFAPYGWERPTRLDGGEPAEPLGEWSEDAAASLGDRLDLAVVYPAGSDDDARDRWLRPGALDAAGVIVEAVPPEPHLAVLADTLLPADVLERRLAFLRLMAWWPEGATVHLTDSGGGALAAHSGDTKTSLPRELSVEDLLAVVARATSVELASPVLRAIRTAYHEPEAKGRAEALLWLDAVAGQATKVVEVSAEERARLTGERVAELESRLEAVQTAYEARGQRLVDERLVFADHVDALQREFGVTRAEVVGAREAADAARSEADAARAGAQRERARAASEAEARHKADALRARADAELDVIKATRSWRWTRAFRALATRLGRRRRS